MGATSNSMGIKFAPATIVIDTLGQVASDRAQGRFLDQVLNQLLAEPIAVNKPELEEVVESAQEKTKTGRSNQRG